LDEALASVTYGVYVVSSIAGSRRNGLIVTTCSQVTSDPPKISITVSKECLTHDMIRSSGRFSVSILKRDTPLSFIGRFGHRSGRDIDKFQDVEYRNGKDGVPIVTENALGYIEAEVDQELDVGSHTILIGRVIDAVRLSDDEPMTYSYYRDVKGGRSPRTAPTYDGWADR